MCGVIGTFQRIGKPLLIQDKDLKRISHRGPDGSGIYSDDHVSLGHVRLSIIDLTSDGAQPMCYRDRYWITFNGEIYNYIELKAELENLNHTFISKSDTEVLLASYAEWKEGCLAKLRGMFSFAIWDKQEKSMFLARDRFGEKPLIYHFTGDRFLFASEFKGIIPLLTDSPDIDLSSVDQFLHYQYVPEPHTLLRGVRKLSAGHYLKISSNSWKCEPVCYWEIETSDNKEIKNFSRAEVIRNKLEEAVNYCLRTDVPVGIALSGGIDSGAIAAFAKKLSSKPLVAFAVGYPGRPAFDERDQAKKLADQLGIPVHEIEIPVDKFSSFFPELVEILDEPIGDIAALGHFSIPKAARDHGIKVILTGIGGDEIFWGYQWVSRIVQLNQDRFKKYYAVPARIIEKDGNLHRFCRRIAHSRFSPTFISHYCSVVSQLCSLGDLPDNQLYFFEIIPDYNYAKNLRQSLYQGKLKESSVRNIQSENKSQILVNDIPKHVMKILGDTWLVSNCLDLGDRVSMSVGVESRLPFLDTDLVETVMTLRKYSPDHQLRQKAWLKEALHGVLSDEILNRSKRGFQPPVIDWLSAVVNEHFGVVRNGRLQESGLINPEKLNELYERRERKEWASLFYLYKLIMLEMWFEKNLNGKVS